MMFWYEHEASGWAYGFMVLSMVLFWGLVFAAGTAFVRHYRGFRPAVSPVPALTPEQVLDGRFARGELDHAEYAARHAALLAHAPSLQDSRRSS